MPFVQLPLSVTTSAVEFSEEGIGPSCRAGLVR